MIQFFSAALLRLSPRIALTGTGDESSLANINTTMLPDGCICWVTGAAPAADFRLLRSDVTPPDGVNIIAPVAGPGRWNRVVTGGAASAVPLSRVLYVDGIQALAAGNGSIALPYGTIQEALDFIGPPANLTEEESFWTINVINAAPPEDIVVPPRRRISIIVVGGPTEVNSITWVDDLSAGFGGSGASLLLDGFKTILTDITVSDSGTAVFGTLQLNGIFVVGGIIGTAYVTGLLLIEIDGAAVVGAINAPAAVLATAVNASLFGNVTIASFDNVSDSVLGDLFGTVTWTVTSSGPRGMLGCQIDGLGAGSFVISGPAGSGRMDGTTNFFFKAGSRGAFAGAATKVLLDDQVP